MAGAKINNYASDDNNITEMQLTEDASFIGFHSLSLTNYKTTPAPTIAAGSYVEVGGALYGFSSAETITGSPSDGVVYIVVIPNGATCTAQFTNTAPTWSDAKQGFYGTGGAATYRYLEYKITKNGGSYTKAKMFYDDAAIYNVLTIDTAVINAEYVTTGTVTTLNSTTANITTLNLGNPLNPLDRISGYDRTGSTSNYYFDLFDAIIPNTNDVIMINGALSYTDTIQGQATYIITSHLVRSNATVMTCYGLRYAGGLAQNYIVFQNGDSTPVSGYIAW